MGLENPSALWNSEVPTFGRVLMHGRYRSFRLGLQLNVHLSKVAGTGRCP